jgi:hypothetical protein
MHRAEAAGSGALSTGRGWRSGLGAAAAAGEAAARKKNHPGPGVCARARAAGRGRGAAWLMGCEGPGGAPHMWYSGASWLGMRLNTWRVYSQ